MSEDPKDQLRRYLPGRDRAREWADPTAAEQRITRALDSTALHLPADDATPNAAAAAATEGKAAATEGDGATATLLSARTPAPPRAATPGEPAGVVVPLRGQLDHERDGRKKPMSPLLVSALAVLAVLVPVTMALAFWPKLPEASHRDGASAAMTITGSVRAAGSVGAPSAAPSIAAGAASAEPSIEASVSGAPSAEPSSQAGAASAEPRIEASAPAAPSAPNVPPPATVPPAVKTPAPKTRSVVAAPSVAPVATAAPSVASGASTATPSVTAVPKPTATTRPVPTSGPILDRED